jgi:hypothetical protein
MLAPVERGGKKAWEAPCGGAEGKESHLLTQMGAEERVILQVTEPDLNGNCSLRMVAGNDFSGYVNLYTENEGLWFSCGRQTGVEQFSVTIPNRYLCSQCVLQLVWQTAKGNQYRCADFTVAVGGDGCLQACLNGGKCRENKCVCGKNWDGEFCEVRKEEEYGTFYYVWSFLLVSLIVTVFSGVVFLYFHQEKIPESVVQFLEKHAKWVLRR